VAGGGSVLGPLVEPPSTLELCWPTGDKAGPWFCVVEFVGRCGDGARLPVALKLCSSASGQGSGGPRGADSDPGGNGTECVEKYCNRPKLSPKSQEYSPVGAKDCSGSCAQEVVGIYDAAKLLKPCPSVGANKEEPVEEAGRSPTFQSKSSRGGKFNQESSKCAEECGWAVGSFLKPELCSPGGSELRSESWAAKAVDKCGGMATFNAVKSGRQVVNFLL
jgi:hypothetical protein